jgi:two-component system response regulator AtoC
MKVLIVDDERNIRESIQRLFELEGIDSVTATDGREGADRLTDQTFDAVVLDLKMPGMDGQALLEWIRAEGLRTPVVMISALGDINDAVKALKSGASDYLIKPFDPTELILKVKAVVQSRKREDLIEAGSRTAEGTVRLLGESTATRALRLMIEKVATGTTTVLITGESGTGKEVVAREIHSRSPNASEPFVAVNIGGIQETLVESELFGHEKGAFTGADTRKTGLFELAAGGTLFLDEIAEMPFPLQVKLLRVLQERKIRRLGGTRDIPIAARIISATNKDIESLVRGGGFREDLYYRLNVVRISVPPLRDRREDIPLLAGNFLEKIRARAGRGVKTLAPDALEALMLYSYPGNIRELSNILERAVITSEDDMIMAADIALDRFPRTSHAAGSAAGSGRPLKPMMELERDALVKALEKWAGNRTKAAEELGISRRTILNKIKQYGL